MPISSLPSSNTRNGIYKVLLIVWQLSSDKRPRSKSFDRDLFLVCELNWRSRAVSSPDPITLDGGNMKIENGGIIVLFPRRSNSFNILSSKSSVSTYVMWSSSPLSRDINQIKQIPQTPFLLDRPDNAPAADAEFEHEQHQNGQ
jgi:hypothetical protein